MSSSRKKKVEAVRLATVGLIQAHRDNLRGDDVVSDYKSRALDELACSIAELVGGTPEEVMELANLLRGRFDRT